MRKRQEPLYQKIGRLLVYALTGQAGTGVTVFVYTTIAVLLLTYVSAQVLTSVLTQEITALSNERALHSETVNRLTAEYVALSSRARVTGYCEQKLGMTAASGAVVRRVAVEGPSEEGARAVEFTHHADPVVDTYGFSTLLGRGETSDG